MENRNNPDAEQLEQMVNSLTEDQIDNILRLNAELEMSRDKDPLPHVILTKPQAEFVSMDKKEAWFFGANSAGKSFAGAYKAACYLRGSDPCGIIKHPIPAPRRKFAGIPMTTKLWMGCVKMDKGVDIIKQNLLPLLKPGSYDFHETRGQIVMRESGASLQVMSYDADTQKWQSDALDGAWLDEQCPFDKYQELRARVARRDGRIWGTATPIYIDSIWMFYEIFQKSQSGENPNVGYVEADLESNVYLTQSMKDQLYAAYKDDEWADARLRGKFIFMRGAIHKSFNRNIHIVPPFPITAYHRDHYNFIRVFDLHPRQNSVMSIIMWRDNPREIYIIDELSMPGGIADMTNFKIEAHNVTAAVSSEFVLTPDVNIVDTPDPAIVNSGPEFHTGAIPVTLRAALARTEYLAGETIPGITGRPPNRDETTAIARTNDHFNHDPQAVFIFSTCKNHIFSIENYRWEEWHGSAAYEKPLKERSVKKDNHEVRNFHFAIMTMPPLNVARAELDERARAPRQKFYHHNHRRVMDRKHYDHA